MESKNGVKRAGEEITPDCDENINLSKKSKTDSLVTEVEKRNLKGLKDLVKQGIDVKIPGNFSLNEKQKFAGVPALFAAIMSDQEDIVHYLVGLYPHFELDLNQELVTLPTDIDREDYIEVLELVGAACIFYGDAGARKHGLSCWLAALKLRFPVENLPLPKIITPPSLFGRHALRNKSELENIEGLIELSKQRRTHWKTQAFFTSERILKKHGCFPNRFLINNFYKFVLKNWEKRGLNPSRAFFAILFLFEMFLEHPSTCHPMKDWALKVEVISVLKEVLQDYAWLEVQLNMEDTILTFENLLFPLRFLSSYLETIQEFFPKKYPVKRTELLDLITDVIIAVGKILISLRKTKTQKAILNDCLAQHLQVYERRWSNFDPNLLLKLSTKRAMQCNQQTELGLIKALLKAGANPNIKDHRRNTTLHLLSRTECLNQSRWKSPSYLPHAKAFTSTVKAILTESFHADQVNNFGHTALEPFKDNYGEYPNAKFHYLLGEFFNSIKPLYCLCAVKVRELGLTCNDLPKTVQVMVSLH